MSPLLRGRTSLIEPCVVAEGKILLEICGVVRDCTMGQRWINLIGQRWINFDFVGNMWFCYSYPHAKPISIVGFHKSKQTMAFIRGSLYLVARYQQQN